MVDPTPEIQKEKLAELDRVARQFGGGGGTDMTKFPDFKFPGRKFCPQNRYLSLKGYYKPLLLRLHTQLAKLD